MCDWCATVDATAGIYSSFVARSDTTIDNGLSLWYVSAPQMYFQLRASASISSCSSASLPQEFPSKYSIYFRISFSIVVKSKSLELDVIERQQKTAVQIGMIQAKRTCFCFDATISIQFHPSISIYLHLPYRPSLSASFEKSWSMRARIQLW